MSGININSVAAFEQEVVYRECRHNHAASLGHVAYDGCREFRKPDIGDVADGNPKDAMLCVACGCHRNFHRKHIVYNPIMTAPTTIPQTHPQPDFPPAAGEAGPSASVARVVQSINPGTTRTARNNNSKEGPVEVPPPPPEGRKKRTMFTVEQRSRMVRFAERLGWRPQKADKEEIQRFCLDMGISRRMFLVWLSNNRRRVVKETTPTAAATAV